MKNLGRIVRSGLIALAIIIAYWLIWGFSLPGSSERRQNQEISLVKKSTEENTDAIKGLGVDMMAVKGATNDNATAIGKMGESVASVKKATEDNATAISKMDEKVDKVLSAVSSPAPAPIPTPGPMAPAPAPAPAPAVEVPTSVLLTELGHIDAAGVAMESALRLARRPRAMRELVETYVSANAEMKKRVRWVIMKMGEPGKTWMYNVLAKVDSFPPTTVLAVKEIIGTFGDVPVSSLRVTQVEARVASLERARTNLLVSMSEADKTRQQKLDELAEKISALNSTIVEWNNVAARANLSHNQRLANQAKQLKELAEKQARDIAQLRRELGAPVYYCK